MDDTVCQTPMIGNRIPGVIEKLEGVKKAGAGKWVARCPAHDDTKPSLSIALGDAGRILLYCHAGCTYEEVCRAGRIDTRDLQPESARQPRKARTITIPRKYLGDVTMRLPTRFMFLTNELPAFADQSGAMASRFLVSRLRNSFLGMEDLDLTCNLLKELPGILNWAIAGWHDLRTAGRFIQPQSGEDAVTEMQDLGSPIKAFVRDCCMLGSEFSAATAALFGAWGRWCSDNGHSDAGTVQAFGKNLMAAVPGLERKRARQGDVRSRQYMGIGLKLVD